MKTLYLHIGHDKTASSYIQSALALSADALHAAGIKYPDMTDHFADAREGKITSGNVHPRRHPLQSYLKEIGTIDAEAMLFSNEGMFHVLVAEGLPRLIQGIRDLGYTPKVLCFVRDPLEHAVSLYQQVVKRAGETAGLAEYLDGYVRPTTAYSLMTQLDALGVDASFVNYSIHRAAVLGVFENWLGLPDAFLTVPQHKTVNRSLTLAELELQRAFNVHLGHRSSKFISDPLCNELPELASVWPALASADLSAFLDRMADAIAAPNEDFLKQNAYRLPTLEETARLFPDPDNQPTLEFSAVQIDVLAKHISQMVQRIEKTKNGG